VDSELSSRIQKIYNDYLKDDPTFQKFYANVHSNRQEQIRQGSPDIKHELSSPEFTLEAQQNIDLEHIKEVEKTRTIADVIKAPRNIDEEIVSAAVQSGLVNRSETQEIEGNEANLGNMKGLLDILEQRAMSLVQHKELERRANQQREAEQAAQEKQNEQAQEKPIQREYGILDDLQKKAQELNLTDGDKDNKSFIDPEVIDTLTKSLASKDSAVDGPDVTPKEARDQAQNQKDHSWFRKPD